MDIQSLEIRRRQALVAMIATALQMRRSAAAREVAGAGGSLELLAAQRDQTLRALRQTDATPSWFTSGNWDNRAYQPWTDYLTGKIDEAGFSVVCANPSDYCLRDVWNLRSPGPASIDWAAKTPFNWNGIHALALRFYRTGEDIYLRKWLAVVSDYGRFSQMSSTADGPLRRGQPQALLTAAVHWGGIFTALGIVAKGLGAKGRRDSPYDALDEVLAPDQLERMPTQALLALASAFASGAAVALAQAYGQDRYVPNQRMFGMEALAALEAFFPWAPGVDALRPAVALGVADVVTRYRLPDGGQLEQSFNYAQDLVNAAARLAKLPHTAPPAWRQQAQETVLGWDRFCAALATPGGGLPQLGNAAWGRFGRSKTVTPFAQTSMAQPYSGLYVMRSDWSADAAYLCLWVRRAARGHSMAGCNSLQMAAHGRLLLTAGGSADYEGKSADPRATRHVAEDSSWKTCTVVVDGRSQRSGSLQGLSLGADGKPDITRAPQQVLQSRWHSSETFDLAEGLYGEGYGPTLDDPRATPVSDVSHLRRVVFVRPLGVWLVLDLLRSQAAHQYTQIWKFAPPAGIAGVVPGFNKGQLELLPEQRLLRTVDRGTSAVNLALRHFGTPALSYEAYFGEGPFGWHNPGPLSRALPALDAHVQWSGAGPQLLLTAILPYKGQDSPLDTASDNSSTDQLACKLVLQGGAQLVCFAASHAATLSTDSHQADRADFLLVLQRKGRPDTGLVLGEVQSHEFGAGRKTPVLVPAGHRWLAGDGGRLHADYRKP